VPQKRERAKSTESTTRHERAKQSESTKRSERANSDESTINLERARPRESTIGEERATLIESAILGERAKLYESANKKERAKERERTKVTQPNNNRSQRKAEREQFIGELFALPLEELPWRMMSLPQQQFRIAVDYYDQVQHQRIAVENQCRAYVQGYDDAQMLETSAAFCDVLKKREEYVAKILQRYVEAHPVGQWAMSNLGVGPISLAYFLAYIDITKAPTAGHIWSYAGYNPDADGPQKGKKRSHNAAMKTACFNLGESMIKVKGYPGAFYGLFYDKRKAYEVAKNEAGEYADQAAAILKRKPDHAQKNIYATGKLPAGHLHSRARRWMVKIFLAHLHHVWYVEEFGELPPKPYVLTLPDHVHEIAIPNYPFNEKQARVEGVLMYREYEPDEFVYYYQRDGQVKIGETKRLDQRINTHDKAAPGQGVLLGVERGDRNVEQVRHRQFAHLREEGEWFRAEPGLLEFIEQNCEVAK